MTSRRIVAVQRLLALLLVVVPAVLSLETSAVPAAAVAAIVLATLTILALIVLSGPEVLATGTRRHTFAWLTRGPTRQCDPDAAGHARPRAPGHRTRAV